MKRVFDIFLSTLLIIVLFIPSIIIYFIVRYFDGPSPIYWSERVGLDDRRFLMPKFRTMRLDTPEVAKHLLDSPEVYVSRVGSFLRRSSLDEIPQLWCILRGEMSFVGPRPALTNQTDLIRLRTSLGIQRVRPGLTGLAQVNGRDYLSVAEKVEWDHRYVSSKGFLMDLNIILLTIYRVISCKDVSH